APGSYINVPSIHFAANVRDDGSVVSVAFKDSATGQILCTATPSSGSPPPPSGATVSMGCDWTTPGGAHNVVAVPTDNSGVSSTSTGESVSAYNVAILVTPASAYTAPGNASISAWPIGTPLTVTVRLTAPGTTTSVNSDFAKSIGAVVSLEDNGQVV